MVEDPTIRIPRDVITVVIGFVGGLIVACLLMIGVFERWRPIVLEWRVTTVNVGTGIRVDESPKSVMWKGIVYDCVKWGGQGTPHSEARE